MILKIGMSIFLIMILFRFHNYTYRNNKWLIYAVLLFIPLFSCNNNDDSFQDEKEIEEIYKYVKRADSQFKFLIHSVDSASEVRGDRDNYIIPMSIRPDGELWLVNSYEWTSGFYPGCCWLLYELGGADYWKEIAINNTKKLEKAASYSQHDLGFMFNNSYGKAFANTNEDYYKQVLLEAAKTLSGRYDPVVGCIQSWGKSEKWNFPVIIDAMMNMELLFEATKLTGDSIYWKRAVSHANKTMENHFRNDYSSYHVVSYIQNTGEVQCKQTSQGYSDESYWSRGQSWGLYGFVICYRYTKDTTYLNFASHIADFLIGLNYDVDKIPYWDMLSPDIPNTPKDASSASIMASALIELSKYVEEKREIYLDYAKDIVKNLAEKYTCEIGSNYGFLLYSTVGNYPSSYQIAVPSIYADYYYLESLKRLKEIYEDYRNL